MLSRRSCSFVIELNIFEVIELNIFEVIAHNIFEVIAHNIFEVIAHNIFEVIAHNIFEVFSSEPGCDNICSMWTSPFSLFFLRKSNLHLKRQDVPHFFINGSIFDRIKKNRAFWLCFICALASFLDQFLVRVFTMLTIEPNSLIEQGSFVGANTMVMHGVTIKESPILNDGIIR